MHLVWRQSDTCILAVSVHLNVLERKLGSLLLFALFLSCCVEFVTVELSDLHTSGLATKHSKEGFNTIQTNAPSREFFFFKKIKNKNKKYSHSATLICIYCKSWQNRRCKIVAVVAVVAVVGSILWAKICWNKNQLRILGQRQPLNHFKATNLHFFNCEKNQQDRKKKNFLLTRSISRKHVGRFPHELSCFDLSFSGNDHGTSFTLHEKKEERKKKKSESEQEQETSQNLSRCSRGKHVSNVRRQRNILDLNRRNCNTKVPSHLSCQSQSFVSNLRAIRQTILQVVSAKYIPETVH